MMEKNSMEFKRMLYELMNGTLDLETHPVPESRNVKNEFEEGGVCGELYKEVFEANRRICERFGVPEDKDVEIIISKLLQIGEYECMKMYDYGALFSKNSK
ncbi:hypothetical protein [Blautia pseudococcoides]|nr:hypothetical protein [Blautia pseudococcoides]